MSQQEPELKVSPASGRGGRKLAGEVNQQQQKPELKVRRIERGTVIDHIGAGLAPTVLEILGIDRRWRGIVIVAMNVSSRKCGRKDIVKVEDETLQRETVDKIALISPGATINHIEDGRVIRKEAVRLPSKITGIVRCPNSNCVSNHERAAVSRFTLVERAEPEPEGADRSPVTLRCHYCERLIPQDEIELVRGRPR